MASNEEDIEQRRELLARAALRRMGGLVAEPYEPDVASIDNRLAEREAAAPAANYSANAQLEAAGSAGGCPTEFQICWPENPVSLPTGPHSLYEAPSEKLRSLSIEQLAPISEDPQPPTSLSPEEHESLEAVRELRNLIGDEITSLGSIGSGDVSMTDLSKIDPPSENRRETAVQEYVEPEVIVIEQPKIPSRRDLSSPDLKWTPRALIMPTTQSYQVSGQSPRCCLSDHDPSSKPSGRQGPSSSRSSNNEAVPRRNDPTPRRQPVQPVAPYTKVKTTGLKFGNLTPIPTDPSVDPPPYTCFNCWNYGHSAFRCTESAYGPFCHNCGRAGENMTTCPRCREQHSKFMATESRSAKARFLRHQSASATQTSSSPSERSREEAVAEPPRRVRVEEPQARDMRHESTPPKRTRASHSPSETREGKKTDESESTSSGEETPVGVDATLQLVQELREYPAELREAILRPAFIKPRKHLSRSRSQRRRE